MRWFMSIMWRVAGAVVVHSRSTPPPPSPNQHQNRRGIPQQYRGYSTHKPPVLTPHCTYFEIVEFGVSLSPPPRRERVTLLTFPISKDTHTHIYDSSSRPGVTLVGQSDTLTSGRGESGWRTPPVATAARGRRRRWGSQGGRGPGTRSGWRGRRRRRRERLRRFRRCAKAPSSESPRWGRGQQDEKEGMEWCRFNGSICLRRVQAGGTV